MSRGRSPEPTDPAVAPEGRRRGHRRVVGGLAAGGLVTFALALYGMQAAADRSSWDPPRAVSSETALQAGAGAVLLVVLLVAAGWALLRLARGRGYLLGVLPVAAVVAEALISVAQPLWRPWLPILNVVALLRPGGKTFELYRNSGFVGWDGPVFVHVGQLRAAAVLTVLTLMVVGAALSTADMT